MKFLLELASEEIPARMQAAAAAQLRTRFVDGLAAAGLAHGEVVADATPRRLWLIADDVAPASAAAREERKGPAASAPEAAIAGFLRSTGLQRDQLEERQTPKGMVLFAQIETPGRAAAAILAELVPAIVRDFQWPKSMRWGAASVSTASPRWVRPLTGIVALLDGEVVACEAHGITAGRVTRGHRIHAPEPISVESADTYVAQLRDAKVIAVATERRAVIETGAAALAEARGLAVVPDAGLVAENAGLTEWPVAMLGGFDPAFLAVPREVIQLTMRTNQKYFALLPARLREGAGVGESPLAPNFICVANLEASDGGAAIVAGNERVLSARLADAKFFWDQDVKAGLASFLPKLTDIVFHEKLGTVADKVERVAKLARWLVESGAITSPLEGEVGLGAFAEPGEGGSDGAKPLSPLAQERESPSPSRGEGNSLADLAEHAARLCKADLVSATVGEFPEVQGIAGAYLARLAGEDPQVADAIRDHYKPVGQGDDVPTAPVSVAVALADKLDTLVEFFIINERPTGSRDPYALRRAALAIVSLVTSNSVRLSLFKAIGGKIRDRTTRLQTELSGYLAHTAAALRKRAIWQQAIKFDPDNKLGIGQLEPADNLDSFQRVGSEIVDRVVPIRGAMLLDNCLAAIAFLADRMKMQQREVGVRHDLIDAVFALGGEDDLVRLLARVKALQAFVTTDDGINLLAGYKRAANILRIEAAKEEPSPDPSLEEGRGAMVSASRKREGSEAALAEALNAALPAAAAAVRAEDFGAAMSALAGLRAPVDAFFAEVMVNDPDPAVRADRLGLLARFRDAVHEVADFSKIEG